MVSIVFKRAKGEEHGETREKKKKEERTPASLGVVGNGGRGDGLRVDDDDIV